MKKRKYLVCLISFSLLASAPLNASAEALDDSFYGEEQFNESSDIPDLEESVDGLCQKIQIIRICFLHR